ncbi:MAG: Bug family tripartite tricarboxylate transporter substrate binding protein [Betaproteobacteria bacterium]
MSVYTLVTGAVVLACGLCCGLSPALAQDYPSRQPIRLVVPFAPGGFTDVVARILSNRLGVALKQSVVVENRPGAGSTIGTEFAARSSPDGYTLVMVSTTHAVNPAVYRRLNYDPLGAFSPVAKLVDAAYVLVVHPSIPVATLSEFIDYVKSRPGVLHYASSGNGSSQHLMAALLASMTGMQMRHVPYRGSAGATQDLLAGIVESSVAGVPNAISHLATGRLRALGVTTAYRIAQLPAVPTFSEAGVSGYDASVWLAILAVAGTPKSIVDLLSEEIRKVLMQADVQAALFDAGVQPSYADPLQTRDLIEGEIAKWGRVIRAIDMKLD